MSSIAEFERDLIRERTRAGKLLEQEEEKVEDQRRLVIKHLIN